ncbi:hypothetical protein H257_19468, partial [Aphanomyces astaci]
HTQFRVEKVKVSPDHKLLAYSVDLTGFETYDVFIKDLTTNTITKAVEGCDGTIEWGWDAETLFYVTPDATSRRHKVWSHLVGAPKSADTSNIPTTRKRQQTPKNDRGRVTGSRGREDAPLVAPLRTRSDLPDDDSHLLLTSGNRHVVGFTPPPQPEEHQLSQHGASVPLPADNDPSDVRDDTDMGSDGGYGRTAPQVWNAPALPQPPTFSGSTKAERGNFMREYQKYLGQINALQL